MLASFILSLTLLATAPAKAARHHAPAANSPTKTIARDTTLPEPDSLFLKVVSGPSQTLSWIGLRNFGAWTPDIATQVLRDNPQLREAPLVAGQTLRLRKSLDRRGLPPLQQIQMASRRAVVTRVAGSVQCIQADGASRPLVDDQFLQAGDRIVTGPQSMAELIIDNQSVLRLRANSQLDLVLLQDSLKLASNKAATQVRLGFGRVWTKVRKWAGPLVGFQVRMPSAIAGVHGTIFECQVASDSSSRVWVEEGVVGVQGLGADTTEYPVGRGQTVQVDSSGRVESASDSDVPDPTDLLPDPGSDAKNSNHDDLRTSIQQTIAQRQGNKETATKFPGHPGEIKVDPHIKR